MIARKHYHFFLFATLVLFTVNFRILAQDTISTNDSIVFLSDATGTYQVYTIDPDGSNLRQITNDKEDNLEVACSPDGYHIATTGDAHWGIRIIDLQTLDSTFILETPDLYEAISWFPSGDKFAFVSAINGKFDIYISNIDGSNLYQVTDNNEWPTSLTVSPDSSKIVYTIANDDYTGLSLLNLFSFSEVALTINTQGIDYTPNWSPIDDEILFTSDNNEFHNFGIYAVDAISGEVHAILNEQTVDWRPTFSPQKDKIAFNSARGGDTDIYIMNVDGTNIRQLTINDASDLNSCWLPTPTLSPISDTADTTQLSQGQQ